jgi:hypothetical protein
MIDKEHIWVTRKGERILIKDMDTNHILNAIGMLSRTGRREKELEWLKKEKNKRLGIVIDEGPIENRFEILDL